MDLLSNNPSLIEPNRELDIFIAEHIMRLSGIGWYHTGDTNDDWRPCNADEAEKFNAIQGYLCINNKFCQIPKYSSKLRDAWQVVEKLCVRIEPNNWADGNTIWVASCEALDRFNHYRRVTAQAADSAPLAIAILAVKYQNFIEMEAEEIETER